MKGYRILFLFTYLLFNRIGLSAQVDTSSAAKSIVYKAAIDTSKIIQKDSTIKKHDPRKATRRSALIPGWGQAYNKEYWKIPLAYGVIAIPVSLFIYNNDWYKKTKFAYEAKYKAEMNKDSSDLALMDPQLKNLSTTSLQSYRNSFRRDRDYSVLWFLVAWGINVVDATVFGHLKDFDVTNDLSLNIKPLLNPSAGSSGVALTLSFKKPEHKLFEVR